MEVLFKYCGGCNPIIDRRKLAGELCRKADLCVHPAEKSAVKRGIDQVCILINGCPAACGSLPQERQGEKCFVVCGSLLRGMEGKEEELAERIMEHL